MSTMTIAPTGVVTAARRGHFVPVVFEATQPPSRAGRILAGLLTFFIGLVILSVPAITTAYAVNTMTQADSVVAVRTQDVPESVIAVSQP